MEGVERDAQGANLGGRHEDALRLFEEALQRCRLPRTLARIALTEASLGRWLAADAHLTEVLRSNDLWIDSHRDALREEAARIGAHVGQLLVTGSGPRGVVRIEGQRVADWPMTEPVRALVGSVRVRVEADGYVAVERTVTVASGVLAREEVALAPAPPPQPPTPTAAPAAPSAVPVVVMIPSAPAEPRPSRANPWSVVAWSALGLGVGVLAVGAVFAVRRGDAVDLLSQEGCYRAAPPVARCNELADVADESRVWITAGFTVGGTLAALAAGAFVASALSGRDGSARAFTCAPGWAGASCGWRF
ncbi:MAG: hypothetical protein EPO40_03210 [Myxococcaceae bacterium]|nr:MAG: hypothetical protein EPO40_03210 [Myxococcaceae bacterium]